MQICEATLKLGGGMTHSVVKEVTPAEILVLRSIHGSDSVVDVRHIHGKDVVEPVSFEYWA